MDRKTMLAFLVTFAAGFAVISLIDSGSIYWIGLIGGLVGAVIAFLTVNYLRQDSSLDTDQ